MKKNALIMKVNGKKRGKRVLPVYEDKNIAKESEENDKKLIGSLNRSKREREKSFWKSLKVTKHVKIQGFKKPFMRFSIDWKLYSIDQKLHSIDPEAVEQRSKQSGSNQNFNCIFDQSKNSFDRSKIWKTQFFEKQSNFLQKLLKALNFTNKMHEYEMKFFSKNLFWT